LRREIGALDISNAQQRLVASLSLIDRANLGSRRFLFFSEHSWSAEKAGTPSFSTSRSVVCAHRIPSRKRIVGPIIPAIAQRRRQPR
jgi:hypothetical protein